MEALSLEEVGRLWLKVLSKKFSLQRSLTPNSGTKLESHRGWFLESPELTITCVLNEFSSFEIKAFNPQGCISVNSTHYWCGPDMEYSISVVGSWIHKFWDWDPLSVKPPGKESLDSLVNDAADIENAYFEYLVAADPDHETSVIPGQNSHVKNINGVHERGLIFELTRSEIRFGVGGTPEEPAILGDIDSGDSVPWNIQFEHQQCWPPIEIFNEISVRFDDALSADEEFRSSPISVEDLIFYRKY